jgi:hypothetical protein
LPISTLPIEFFIQLDFGLCNAPFWLSSFQIKPSNLEFFIDGFAKRRGAWFFALTDDALGWDRIEVLLDNVNLFKIIKTSLKV